MQTERRVAANPQTKPTDLGCESAERLAATIRRHHRHLLLLLNVATGRRGFRTCSAPSRARISRKMFSLWILDPTVTNMHIKNELRYVISRLKKTQKKFWKGLSPLLCRPNPLQYPIIPEYKITFMIAPRRGNPGCTYGFYFVNVRGSSHSPSLVDSVRAVANILKIRGNLMAYFFWSRM